MEKRLVGQAKEGANTLRQPIWFSFENSLEVFPLSFLHIQADPGEKALGRKGQCSLDSPLFSLHPFSTNCLRRLRDPSPPHLVFLLSLPLALADPPLLFSNPSPALSVIFSFRLPSLSGLWELRKVRQVVPANQLCHCPSEHPSVF